MNHSKFSSPFPKTRSNSQQPFKEPFQAKSLRANFGKYLGNVTLTHHQGSPKKQTQINRLNPREWQGLLRQFEEQIFSYIRGIKEIVIALEYKLAICLSLFSSSESQIRKRISSVNRIHLYNQTLRRQNQALRQQNQSLKEALIELRQENQKATSDRATNYLYEGLKKLRNSVEKANKHQMGKPNAPLTQKSYLQRIAEALETMQSKVNQLKLGQKEELSAILEQLKEVILLNVRNGDMAKYLQQKIVENAKMYCSLAKIGQPSFGQMRQKTQRNQLQQQLDGRLNKQAVGNK